MQLLCQSGGNYCRVSCLPFLSMVRQLICRGLNSWKTAASPLVGMYACMSVFMYMCVCVCGCVCVYVWTNYESMPLNFPVHVCVCVCVCACFIDKINQQKPSRKPESTSQNKHVNISFCLRNQRCHSCRKPPPSAALPVSVKAYTLTEALTLSDPSCQMSPLLCD